MLFPGYTIEAPIDSSNHLRRALQQVLANTRVQATVGLEAVALPIGLHGPLADAGMKDSTAIDGWLTALRMVKTAGGVGQAASQLRPDRGGARRCP